VIVQRLGEDMPAIAGGHEKELARLGWIEDGSQ
jgi:hypothetical protein